MRARSPDAQPPPRSALQAAFGASDAALDAVLPPKCDLRIAKVASPSRASVYTVDGAPILVDVSSKGDWLPTVFALWRAPDLLPIITLKHADVAHFLLGAHASNGARHQGLSLTRAAAAQAGLT